MINDGTALVAYRVALAARGRGHVLVRRGRARVPRQRGRRRRDRPRRRLAGPADHPPPVRQGAQHLRLDHHRLRAATSSAEEAHVSGVLGAVASRHLQRLERAHRARRRHAPVGHRVLAGDGRSASRRCCSCCSACRRRRSPTRSTSPRSLSQALAVASSVIAVRMAWALIPGGPASATRCASGSRSAGRACAARSRSPPRSRSRPRCEERPEILLLTFGVILVTLLGQGLTLAAAPARARPAAAPSAGRPTRRRARLETAQAALDRLEELEEEGAAPEPLRRLRELYRAALRALRRGARRRRPARGRPPRAARVRRDAARADRRPSAPRCSGCATRAGCAARCVARVERDLDLEEARIRA